VIDFSENANQGAICQAVDVPSPRNTATQREDTDLPRRAPSPAPLPLVLSRSWSIPRRRYRRGGSPLAIHRSVRPVRPRSPNGHNARAFRGAANRALFPGVISRVGTRAGKVGRIFVEDNSAPIGVSPYPPRIDNARKAGKKGGKGKKERNCTPVEAKRISTSGRLARSPYRRRCEIERLI